MHAMLLCATAVVCAATGCHYYGEAESGVDGDVGELEDLFCPPTDDDDSSVAVHVDGDEVETDGAVGPDAGIADSGAAPDARLADRGPEERPMYCEHDGHCGGGVCIDAMCHRACTDSEECGTGQGCVAGLCDYDPTCPVECALSTDCPEDGVCIDGACHALCAEDSECTDPDDFCDHGLCRPDFRPITECATRDHCPSGRSCVNGLCRVACWADDECASGACRAGFCS